MQWILFLIGIDDKCFSTITNHSEINCLMCVDEGCGYCWSNQHCYSTDSESYIQCADKTSTRDQKCISIMGGDYNPKVRYIIGAAIIIITLLVDLPIRFCTNDEYQQL